MHCEALIVLDAIFHSEYPSRIYTLQFVKESNEDYFTTTKNERKKARKEACEIIEETLKSKKLTDEDKKSAIAKTEQIADRIEKESNIEALLKAKGFEDTIAVINEKGISIVLRSEGLTSSETLQIQDIVTNETKISLADIKIIPIA